MNYSVRVLVGASEEGRQRGGARTGSLRSVAGRERRRGGEALDDSS
jgi:hypothetical protein